MAQTKAIDSLQQLIEVADELDAAARGNASVSASRLKQWSVLLRKHTNSLSKALAPVPSPPKTAPVHDIPKYSTEMNASAPLTASPALRSATVGNVLSGALSLFLECTMFHTRSQRVCVYQWNRAQMQLQLTAACGQVGSSVRMRAPVPSERGLVGVVYRTKIAANLQRCHSDDFVDVKGVVPPSHTTLCFPLISPNDSETCLGVIQVSNKYSGATPFHAGDEVFLYFAAQTVSYLIEHYTVDIAAHTVDLSSLHALFPPVVHIAPAPVRPSTKRASPNGSELAATTSVVDHDNLDSFLDGISMQLIYRSHNAGKHLRSQHIHEDAVQCDASGSAKHLVEADEYITRLEACWKNSVVDTMEHERREGVHRQQVHDVRDLLKRKQQKIQVLKEAIRDEVMTNLSQDVKIKEMVTTIHSYQAEEEERRAFRTSKRTIDAPDLFQRRKSTLSVLPSV